MITKIIKRDGREVPFNIEKITNAIYKAAQAIGGKDYNTALKLSEMVADRLDEIYKGRVPTVEQVQDCVEKVLVETGHARTAKEYILYRAQRTRVREMNTRLMKLYERLTFKDEKEPPEFSANGTLYRYGAEGAKQFYEMFVIDPNFVRANDSGNFYLDHCEAYGLTTQSCQIDLERLFANGFSSGKTAIREPMGVASACALCALALQLNQNDQHGPQSIPNFDFAVANAVRKTYRRIFRQELTKAADLISDLKPEVSVSDLVLQAEQETGLCAAIEFPPEYLDALYAKLLTVFDQKTAEKLVAHARTWAFTHTDRSLCQALDAMFSELNTASTRGGAGLPDTAIQYGTDTSPEGRLVIKNALALTERGLGNGEDALWPKQFFKCKNRVNTRADDPNYDLYELACKTAQKRGAPYFIFLDAPCNARGYRPGAPESEAGYFSDGSRVLEDRAAPDQPSVPGRGVLSSTFLNLPRIAIRAQKNQDVFFDELDRKLDMIFEQLSERLKLQGDKRACEFPFLMGNGVWMGANELDETDQIAGILRHGTLAVGFVGLAEALVSLVGAHHGASDDAQSLGLEIVAHLRRRCDQISEKQSLNFVLTGVDSPTAARRFAETDRELYGEIPGVTDKARYTASFCVPDAENTDAKSLIALSAPYHELSNGGHCTVIDPRNESVQKVLEAARVSGLACAAIAANRITAEDKDDGR